MKTLITLQKYLSDHIITNRDKYPALKSFVRITNIDAIINESNQQSSMPKVIASTAQILEYCNTITENIHKAQHLMALYRFTKQFNLDITKWQHDPDPIIKNQYKQILSLEDMLKSNNQSHMISIGENLSLEPNIYIYDSHLPLPYLKTIAEENQFKIPPVKSKVNIIHIDQALSPDHLEKLLNKLAIKQCIISGSDHMRLQSLSEHMTKDCTQFPKQLTDTNFFNLWLYLWQIPKAYIELRHLRKIFLSPYVSPTDLDSETIDTFLSESQNWPSTHIDLNNNMLLANEIKSFLSTHFSFIQAHDQSSNDWLNCCQKIADHWGISIPEKLSSYDAALFKQWERLLLELTSLRSYLSHDSWVERCKILASLLNISSSTDQDISFQVIKSLPGIRADHLILLDMDDLSWLNDTSKFVLTEQDQEAVRSYHRSYQTKLTQTLSETFSEIYVIVEPDKRTEKISSLNGKLSQLKISEITEPTNLQPYNLYSTSKMTTERLKRATHVISEYATCPARGYLVHRLNIQKNDKITSGTDPRLRGTIIHDWVANYPKYQTKKSRKTLIHEALNVARGNGYIIPLNTEVFEVERLLKMMTQFDALTESNPEILQISDHEKTLQAEINGVTLKARIDGLLSIQGKNIIIDYKTSSHSVSGCVNSPLKNPQLPLYSLMLSNKSFGICYINIETGKSHISGISWDIKSAQNPLPSMENPLENWQTQFERTIDQINLGYALPKPESKSACNQCDVANICRHKYMNIAYE